MRRISVGFVVALLCGLNGLTEEPGEKGTKCELQLRNGSPLASGRSAE